MSVGKLVIRGTSKMSLHDRFTQLNYQVSLLKIITKMNEPHGLNPK